MASFFPRISPLGEVAGGGEGQRVGDADLCVCVVAALLSQGTMTECRRRSRVHV
jgi:hypothetical protein